MALRLATIRHLRPGHLSRGVEQQVKLVARRRVVAALAAAGGHGSLPGACLWTVVGEERTLNEFALRQRWVGRVINRHMACGILVAALAILARHYGYDRP